MAASGGEEDAECSKSKMDEEMDDTNDLTSTEDFSVTNPFESHLTIDSLLQPSFSPSVFSVTSPSDAKGQKGTSFWNIDQIAVLNPAEIDMSALHTQQNIVHLDPANEVRAQQAIDEFFASRIEMPSPWSSDRSNNHYLALISPSPAQMNKHTAATPLTSKNTSSSLSSSSHLRVRRLALSSIKNSDGSSSIMREEKAKKETKNISTQTTLTLPKDFDLEAVLGKYYTFGKQKENANEGIGNTSLRRKLFFPDGREVNTRDQDGEINLNALQHIDDIDDFIDSPVSLKKIAAKSNNLTPLNHGHSSQSGTSSTCHSHYSSSPVRSIGNFDIRTPSSGDILRHCGSGVRMRRRMIGSSEEREKESVTTPEVSPVKHDNADSHSKSSELHVIEPIDESMSFQVSSDEYKTAPESSGDVRTVPENMESSRRDLGIEIPPFSPIQPIKHKTSLIKASSNQNVESTHQSLITVANSLDDLCESPMLSPIQGKQEVRQNCCDIVKNVSLLSSTTTKPVSKFKCNQSVLSTTEASENRPFHYYEKVQYSCENKENIHPKVTYSSMNNFDEDVSMTSQTSVCQESIFNEDGIQCDSFIEARNLSVLQNNQVSSNQIDEKTPSTKRFFHQLTEDTLSLYHSVSMRTAKRPSSGMDIAVSKCYGCVKKVPDTGTGTEHEKHEVGNQDSGYATTQSNQQQ